MYRNPAALLALDREPATCLMRACGIDDGVIRNGSDYDRFVAFATAVPLCAGHTLAAAMVEALQKETKLMLPLDGQTAPLYWQTWVDIHWYRKPPRCPSIPAELHSTPPACAPTVLSCAEVTVLPDLMAICAESGDSDLAWLTERLRSYLPASGYVLLSLPDNAAFCRPDPYHALCALQAIAGGRETARDRDLLLCQSLRILGELMVGNAPRHTLLLRGGQPEVVLSILDYLNACDRLPMVVWLPLDPADAARISGLYARVATGYTVSVSDTPVVRADKQTAYAAVAPLGRGVLLEV